MENIKFNTGKNILNNEIYQKLVESAKRRQQSQKTKLHEYLEKMRKKHNVEFNKETNKNTNN